MAATPKSTRRTASKEARRQQLIDATMKCIARNGMGSTSIGDVAREAGLSQGIVNLHFQSKDNLLNETLQQLSDEYTSQFDKVLETAGPAAAEKLRALMALDFRASICDRRKLAVWFAFYGEVKSRPAYQRICQNREARYDTVVEDLCEDIIRDGNYTTVTAKNASNTLFAMTNGLYLDRLVSPGSFDRHEAMGVIDEYLQNVFPKHFPLRD